MAAQGAARAAKVKQVVSQERFAAAWTTHPFNSGYFMCVRLKGADPEAVRKILLEEYSTGIIAASGLIRVAFSATPYDLLDDLFANIYAATKKAQG